MCYAQNNSTRGFIYAIGASGLEIDSMQAEVVAQRADAEEGM